jgi:hypothetical protein
MTRSGHRRGGVSVGLTHVLLIVALLTTAQSVGAQVPTDGGGLPGTRRDPAAQGVAGQDLPQAVRNRRQLMERQLRRGLWRLAKDRVGFDDAQMRQLESTTQRYDQRRRALAQEERTVRQSLRQQILADRSADQTAVSTALDRLHELQRQRFELQAEEQKEFSTFMTPLQRAKYAALQEQVRRRLEDLRRARPDTSTVGVSAP